MFEIPEDDHFWDELPMREIPDRDNNDLHVSESLKIDCGRNAQTRVNREVNLKRCKRKFPGPAGILPPPSPGSLLNVKLNESPELKLLLDSPRIPDHNTENENNSLSQASADDIFTSEAWKSLVADLGPDSTSLLAKFSLKSMLLKASRKLLPRGKIPLILGVIERMDMQGSDAAVVIRDPTGKMNGSLHQDLIKDPNTAIQPGSVVILRQVSVISPSNRTHYLNITPGNIMLIYSTNRQEGVAKRPWISPSVSSPESKVCTKNTVEILSLHEIIEESEQELAMSLRNFRQNLNRSTSSITSSLVSPKAGDFMSPSSSSLFSPRFISPSPSGSTTSKLPIHRPRLFPPSNPPASYSSNPRANYTTYSPSNTNPPIFHPQNRNRATVPPHAKKGITPNLSKSSYMISGAEAIRSCGTSATDNHMKYSSTHSSNLTPQHIRSVTPNMSVSNLQSLCADRVKTDTRNRLVHDSFPDDDDDHEILQLCDATIGQASTTDARISQTGSTDSNTDNVTIVNHPLNNMISPVISTDNEVVDKVFNDCRSEELITNCLSRSKSDQELHSIPAEPPLLRSNCKIKSGHEKKFTFKRSVSSVQCSPVAVPPKRPMFEPNISSYTKALNSNGCRPAPLSTDKNSNTNLTVTQLDIVASCSDDMLFKHPGCPTLTAPVVDSLMTCGKAAERDPRIQLGQRNVNLPPAGQQPAKNLFAHWDDDLNDDILLSQLSEDF